MQIPLAYYICVTFFVFSVVFVNPTIDTMINSPLVDDALNEDIKSMYGYFKYLPIISMIILIIHFLLYSFVTNGERFPDTYQPYMLQTCNQPHTNNQNDETKIEFPETLDK